VAISGKVSAASVGAAAATLVSDIVARHAFHGQVPGDVLALVGASVTAAVTFACGYMARHVPITVQRVAEDVASSAVAEFVDPAPLAATESVAAPAPVPPVGG
jgi:hypothetical protein